MSDYYQNLEKIVQQRITSGINDSTVKLGELTLTVNAESLIEVMTQLRDDSELAFHQLIDLSGVDYSEYGETPWQGDRFAVVYHLISTDMNHRIRVRAFIKDREMPLIDSVTEIWSGANWYERETFDMYGIVFNGHPDLRRILTDYGFIGHPFRKDFPLSGHVEMVYDEDKGRLIYRPVSIEPRDQVPLRYRDDHRYLTADQEGA